MALFQQLPNQVSGFLADIKSDGIPADSFMLPSSASINQVKVWGGYYPNNVDLGTNGHHFSVIIHEDDGGLPDENSSPYPFFETTSVQGTSCVETGKEIETTPEHLIELECTIELSQTAQLDGGKVYWIEIINTTPEISTNGDV